MASPGLPVAPGLTKKSRGSAPECFVGKQPSSRGTSQSGGLNPHPPVSPPVSPSPSLPSTRSTRPNSAYTFVKQVQILCDDGDELEVKAFLDSGASLNAIDKGYLRSVGLSASCVPLRDPVTTVLFDGTLCRNAYTHRIRLSYRIGEQVFEDWFHVGKVHGDQPMCLGLDWLQRYNPIIDWTKQTITEVRTGPAKGVTLVRAGNTFRAEHVSLFPGNELADPLPGFPSTDVSAAFSAGGVLSAIEAEQARRDLATHQAFVLLSARSACIDRLEENRAVFARSSAPAPAVRGLTDPNEDWKSSVPSLFWRFESVFSPVSAGKLPPHRPDRIRGRRIGTRREGHVRRCVKAP